MTRKYAPRSGILLLSSAPSLTLSLSISPFSYLSGCVTHSDERARARTHARTHTHTYTTVSVSVSFCILFLSFLSTLFPSLPHLLLSILRSPSRRSPPPLLSVPRRVFLSPLSLPLHFPRIFPQPIGVSWRSVGRPRARPSLERACSGLDGRVAEGVIEK